MSSLRCQGFIYVRSRRLQGECDPPGKRRSHFCPKFAGLCTYLVPCSLCSSWLEREEEKSPRSHGYGHLTSHFHSTASTASETSSRAAVRVAHRDLHPADGLSKRNNEGRKRGEGHSSVAQSGNKFREAFPPHTLSHDQGVSRLTTASPSDARTMTSVPH